MLAQTNVFAPKGGNHSRIKYQLRDFKGKGWCLAEPKDQSWRTLPVFNQRVWEILRRRQIAGKRLRKPLPIEGSERTIDDLVFVNRRWCAGQ
jgi:hypothetical protein